MPMKLSLFSLLSFDILIVTGFRNAMNDLSGKPELKLSGYAWNPYNLYRTGVPAQTLYNIHNPWPKTGESGYFLCFDSSPDL